MLNNDMNRLFAEGGMNQQGGTKDPVSGNDVPPGALQSEVRDDIPAKLSEGEFVIPADVVRYIGLERLMKLRDEAKTGLAKMEEIGQMGNADQVENPEELHGDGFSKEIDSIMAEVDSEAPQEEGHFRAGGVVQVPSADKDILAKYNIPRTAITNPALDVRMLKNDAGNAMYMTYFNGKPSAPIPAGYVEVPITGTATGTGTGTTTGSTTKVTSVGGGGKDTLTSGDMAGSGSKSTTLNSDLSALAVLGGLSSSKLGGGGTDTTKTGGTDGTGTAADVNSYGGAITSDAKDAVSTGVGGFTLNPDGSVTPNTINGVVVAAAGLFNPIAGLAARGTNYISGQAAKDFSASIADTMGANANPFTEAATAGRSGSGNAAATAAAAAADAAKALGLSDAAAGAASQAAADAVIRGKSASDAANAGSDAAAGVAKTESAGGASTDKAEATARESLGGWNELDTGFSGGGTGGGGKYFDDGGNATMAMAKGGLVTKRSKKSKK